MGKSISITVHPSALGAEYLSVSDAMRQVLDLVEALERTEAAAVSERQIVWRLTDAHTNSPPFTVHAEAFPVNPAVFIDVEATRVASQFEAGLQELLEGRASPWLDKDVATPLKRALERNLNGVGRTEIGINDNAPFNVVPVNAKAAVVALERVELEWEAERVDLRRTEFGAVEVEVSGITRWYDKPALSAVERLSRDKLTCVLSPELASRLGAHRWDEAWEGERLLVSGALHYGVDGSLVRIEADEAEEMPWTDVQLADLGGIDILEGRTVKEHLEHLRGSDLG